MPKHIRKILYGKPNATNTSGKIGVSYHAKDKTWRAKIRVNDELIYLGSYRNLEEAIKAKEDEERYLLNKYYKSLEESRK